MRKLFLIPAALFVVIACDTGTDLIGDDVGILRDGDNFTLEPQDMPASPEQPNDMLEMGVDDGFQGNFQGFCMGPDDLPMDPPMQATGGAGWIAIQHEGVETGTSPQWLIHGWMDEPGGTIEMTYEETNPDPSAETCLWSMEYVIHGVPAGDWTITARYDSAQATVTEPL